jgi:2,5-diketo-D-gluconate reductase A
MENVILNNGVKMALLGFCTYLLRDGFECEQAVLNALNVGYRLIGAAVYNNQDSVGRAIKKGMSNGKKSL